MNRAARASALAFALGTGVATVASAEPNSFQRTASGGTVSESASVSMTTGAAGASSGTTPSPVLTDEISEERDKTYLYLGLRYRGTIIPKFMMSLLVDEGATLYSNTIGAELDIRRNGFSFIPAVSFTEYGTGDILFREKGTDSKLAGNWSVVNSSLKAFYFTADVLWSKPISRAVDFEYGAGFGFGVMFGGLENNWVYESPNGPLTASSGQRFQRCSTQFDAVGCSPADHQNKNVDDPKVGHHEEKSWFNGGYKPNFFPHLSIPQVGLRIHPGEGLQARLGLGFSLTGFWFGLSGNYDIQRLAKL